jgi:hypothetical protein
MFAYNLNGKFARYVAENVDRITKQDKIEFNLAQSSKWLYVCKLLTQLKSLDKYIIYESTYRTKLQQLETSIASMTIQPGTPTANDDIRRLQQYSNDKAKLMQAITEYHNKNRDMFVLIWDFIMTPHDHDDMHAIDEQYSDGFKEIAERDEYAILYYYTKEFLHPSNDSIFDDEQKARLDFMGINQSSLLNSSIQSDSIELESAELKGVRDEIQQALAEPKIAKTITETNKMINNMSKKWLKTQVVNMAVDSYTATHKGLEERDIRRYANDWYNKISSWNYIKLYQTFALNKYKIKYTPEQVQKLIDTGFDKNTKQ